MYINDDHGLILAYFVARSIVVTHAFIWGRLKLLNGKNLQKVTEVICLPRELSATAPGLYIGICL